jgi:hypothetical protein
VTLFEVLICITIIATVLAILLPVMNQVRFAAIRITCQSNLRQLHQATLVFSEERRGEFMCMSGGNVWRWFRDIMPYLTHNPGSWNNNPSIVSEVMTISKCPAFKGVVTDPTNGNIQWDSRGYAINARPRTPDNWSHTLLDWWWWTGAGGQARLVRLAAIDRKSERYLFTDGDWGAVTGPNWFSDWKGVLQAGNIDEPTVWGNYSPNAFISRPRHQGLRNVISFDGSSRSVPLSMKEWLLAN